MFVVRIYMYYNHSDVCSKKWQMFESGLKKVLSSALISGCHQNEIALNPKCLPANQDPVIDGFSILFAILMEHNFHLFYFSPQCACLSPFFSPSLFSPPLTSPIFVSFAQWQNWFDILPLQNVSVYSK